MKFIKLFGRTSIWMDHDAFGQSQYRIYPPFSPPTVDVNGCVSVRLDRVQAYEEAKRIDAIFNRAFEACLEQRKAYHRRAYFTPDTRTEERCAE